MRVCVCQCVDTQLDSCNGTHTQGMNMLVAVGLLFLDEETTFWLLVLIIEKMTPKDYYTPGLLGAQADQVCINWNTHADYMSANIIGPHARASSREDTSTKQPFRSLWCGHCCDHIQLAFGSFCRCPTNRGKPYHSHSMMLCCSKCMYAL